MEDLNLGQATMPKIDIIKYKTYKYYDGDFIIKEIPGLELGIGSDTFAYPLEILVCKKCGEILKDHQEELGLNDDKKETKNSSLII